MPLGPVDPRRHADPRPVDVSVAMRGELKEGGVYRIEHHGRRWRALGPDVSGNDAADTDDAAWEPHKQLAYDLPGPSAEDLPNVPDVAYAGEARRERAADHDRRV